MYITIQYICIKVKSTLQSVSPACLRLWTVLESIALFLKEERIERATAKSDDGSEIFSPPLARASRPFRKINFKKQNNFLLF